MVLLRSLTAAMATQRKAGPMVSMLARDLADPGSIPCSDTVFLFDLSAPALPLLSSSLICFPRVVGEKKNI